MRSCMFAQRNYKLLGAGARSVLSITVPQSTMKDQMSKWMNACSNWQWFIFAATYHSIFQLPYMMEKTRDLYSMYGSVESKIYGQSKYLVPWFSKWMFFYMVTDQIRSTQHAAAMFCWVWFRKWLLTHETKSYKEKNAPLRGKCKVKHVP